jgi:hypothetical protein
MGVAEGIAWSDCQMVMKVVILLDDKGKNDTISDHPSANATFVLVKRDGKKKTVFFWKTVITLILS